MSPVSCVRRGPRAALIIPRVWSEWCAWRARFRELVLLFSDFRGKIEKALKPIEAHVRMGARCTRCDNRSAATRGRRRTRENRTLKSPTIRALEGARADGGQMSGENGAQRDTPLRERRRSERKWEDLLELRPLTPIQTVPAAVPFRTELTSVGDPSQTRQSSLAAPPCSDLNRGAAQPTGDVAIRFQLESLYPETRSLSATLSRFVRVKTQVRVEGPLGLVEPMWVAVPACTTTLRPIARFIQSESGCCNVTGAKVESKTSSASGALIQQFLLRHGIDSADFGGNVFRLGPFIFDAGGPQRVNVSEADAEYFQKMFLRRDEVAPIHLDWPSGLACVRCPLTGADVDDVGVLALWRVRRRAPRRRLAVRLMPVAFSTEGYELIMTHVASIARQSPTRPLPKKPKESDQQLSLREAWQRSQALRSLAISVPHPLDKQPAFRMGKGWRLYHFVLLTVQSEDVGMIVFGPNPTAAHNSARALIFGKSSADARFFCDVCSVEAAADHPDQIKLYAALSTSGKRQLHILNSRVQPTLGVEVDVGGSGSVATTWPIPLRDLDAAHKAPFSALNKSAQTLAESARDAWVSTLRKAMAYFAANRGTF